jgi:hypothetical protein
MAEKGYQQSSWSNSSEWKLEGVKPALDKSGIADSERQLLASS